VIRAARTTLTLVFLAAMLLGATIWGWAAVTRPFPSQEDLPVCEDRTVSAGTKVYPDQVAVSVFNASTRSGLAGRTLDLFGDAGFAKADDGNAPRGTKVATAQIWSATPKNPAVKLVRSYLGKGTPVVAGDRLGAGVVVVVGGEFTKLKRGAKAASSRQDSIVCSPPGSTD
jgi:hypothetical protein